MNEPQEAITFEAVATARKQSGFNARKPRPGEFFRVHPEDSFRRRVATYTEPGDAMDLPVYWVAKPVQALLPVKHQLLQLTANRDGGNFLWLIPLHVEGETDGQTRLIDSRLAAWKAAHDTWVKMDWNNGTRSYDFVYAVADLGKPHWTDLTLAQAIALAFPGNRVISSPDHPMVLRALGRA
jgi:hypothetical protein